MIMPDRIYTYQQSMIIMKIEELEYLMSHHRKSAKRNIFRLYKSIVRRTNREAGLPNHLRYDVFFATTRKSSWKRRYMDDKISDWLDALHTYYDETASKNAPR